MVDPTDTSLDKSIPQHPLKPELSPSLTLLPAEDKQESPSDPQPLSLSPTSPAHSSLEPVCSLSSVVDDPPPRAIDGSGGEPASDPTPDLATPVQPPPPLPSVLPIHSPPSPIENPTAQSTIAPLAHQPDETSLPAAEPPAEQQSRLNRSSPQPLLTTTTTHSLPAVPLTTSTTATSLPQSPVPLPVAAILHKDLLPTPPVSDCSPPQLDSIDCPTESPPLPTNSPPLLADFPQQHLPQPTTTSSPVVDSAPPLLQQPPPASISSQSTSSEQAVGIPVEDPLNITRQSSPPPPTTNASVNSLSPLSDVPSAHSPTRVIQSPPTRSQSVLSPHASPVSIKRQASPSMHENLPSRTEGSPVHVNGHSLYTNGQSSHKRPRLASESSPNPPIINNLANPPVLTTPLQPQPQQHHLDIATHSAQTMAQPAGLIPGHPGTRLTKDQHRFAISVIKQLKKHRHAHPFLEPVDPVKFNIPDYFTVVTHPMDLGTIEKRLGKVGKPCHYTSVQEFIADVQQVFNNCYLYNGDPQKSQYSKMATELSNQFDTHLNKMPPDEPISYPVARRSPTIAKPQSKTKPSAEFRPSPPIAKRKNASPMGNVSSLPTGHAGTSQKRRSISPQHPRKKTSKATSLTGSTFPDGNTANSQVAWRASVNDPSSSQRPKIDARENLHTTVNHYVQSAMEPRTISNSKAELKFCSNVLREVNKKVYEKFAWPFYEPVDIVKLCIPEYPKYVKRPMDLQTMKTKLLRNEYPNGAAFAEDFRLMLRNCYAFNPPSTSYYNCGKQMESWFEAKWAERPPAEILAPVPPPTAAAVEPPALDPIQVLQIQVAQLQERLNVETSSNARNNPAHVIPGTGPPKKQPLARGSAQSKSFANPSTSGPLIPEAAPPPPPKSAKANSTGPTKPKQNPGGNRRKSAASTLAPAAKHSSQPLEQAAPVRQLETPEPALQSYRAVPLPNAAFASESFAAPPQAVSRRFSGSDYFEKIDYEQKKDLATQIQNAVEPMQSDAINLIRTSRPDLVPADGEEIELDIDALDDRTLYKLYQLVCTPPPPPPVKGKKGTKGNVTNGKPKGARRKAGPAAARKSSMTAALPYTTTAPQLPGFVQESEAPHAWPHPVPQVPNGHGNGTKPKPVKKPRANAPGPRRKGIDETQEAARIKELEEKLHEFEGYTDPQPPHQNHHLNGVSSTNPALGLALNEPPPAGPVEYASSSSESESDSDDDSD